MKPPYGIAGLWNAIQANEEDPTNDDGWVKQDGKSVREYLESKQWDAIILASHVLTSTLFYEAVTDEKRRAEHEALGKCLEYIKMHAPRVRLFYYNTFLSGPSYEEFEHPVASSYIESIGKKRGKPIARPFELFIQDAEADIRRCQDACEAFSLSMIPVRQALWLAHVDAEWGYIFTPTDKENTLEPPRLPANYFRPSLHVGPGWEMGKSGKPSLKYDWHLNMAGSYMVGCMIFQALTGKDAIGNSFVPYGRAAWYNARGERNKLDTFRTLSTDECRILQEIAAKAMKMKHAPQKVFIQEYMRMREAKLENKKKGIYRASRQEMLRQLKTSLLHGAAADDNIEYVKLLIAEGADVNARDAQGRVPALIALCARDLPVTNLLLEKGADTAAPHLAAYTGDLRAIKRLLEKDGPVDSLKGLTLLHAAAAGGHAAVVEFLIANGFEVTATTENDATPLHYAALGNHPKVAEILLANGADVNMKSKDGLTPLHASAVHGDTGTVTLLIENGADVNAKNENGAAPLSVAAGEGHIDSVKLLIANGANVNAKNNYDGTPLIWTASEGHTDVVGLLLAKGADVNTRNKWGWTPLHYACVKNHKDTAELLLAKGVDINAREEEGKTPLAVAAAYGHKEVSELLIAKGAKVNVKSGELYAYAWRMTDGSWSPLHAACFSGSEEVAKLLLAHGAAVNAKTRNSFTPLDLARKRGHQEVARMLLNHGAKEGIPVRDRFKNARSVSSGTWFEGSFQYRTDEEWFVIDVEDNKSYLIQYDDSFTLGDYSAYFETYFYKQIVDDLASKHCLFVDRRYIDQKAIKFTSDYNGILYLRLISGKPGNTTFAIKYEIKE